MHLLGRRNFLAGLGFGAASPLLGPMIKGFLPEALGATAGAGRKRFFLITSCNGFLERFTTCTARSETDFDLAPIYKSLEPYKGQLVIAHRFFNPFSKANHGNQYATLNVTETTNRSVSQFRGPPGGVSIDRLIAQEIGKDDSFSSTAMSAVRVRKSGDPNAALTMSADGPNRPYPAWGVPSRAFAELFGGAARPGAMGQAPTGGFESTFAQDKSVLDLITEDVGRVRRRLGSPEQAKLDQYLESLGELEKEVMQRQIARSTCSKPTAPAAATDVGAQNETLNQGVLEAMIDLSFQAQKCNLTHVSHVGIEGMEAPHAKYTWLGQTNNHHDDHHAYNFPVLQKIATWWMDKTAQMVANLAATPEGNGTMLDNSIVLFINCCGGSHHDGQNKHPVVMIAGKNTGLRGGRYLQYPEGSHCISDFYVSLANLFLAVPIKSFGDPSVCKGPLPGLV